MRILEGISLQVAAGELVCLLGGNASGKPTTLKTILGIVRPRSGHVLLGGRDVTQWPVPQRIAAGLAIVPENRRLLGQLTVSCCRISGYMMSSWACWVGVRAAVSGR